MTVFAHGIVMTDLFVSATAALLLVLAVLQPIPPIRLPIQADLIARCPDGDPAPATPLALVAGSDPDGPSVSALGPTELGAAPVRLGLPARLFYTIAVEGTAGGPVSAACLDWITRDFVRAYNGALAEADRLTQPRAIFAVAPAVPDGTGASP